jgi:serralysin
MLRWSSWLTWALGCLLFSSLVDASEGPEIFEVGGSFDVPAAFRTVGNGWTSTSSGASSLGNPVVLTWSIVPDGTFIGRAGDQFIPDESSDPSGLVAFLDDIHHSGGAPGGADLTQRNWWGLFNSAFERWESVAGITFSYEPSDDGRVSPNTAGQLGRRGDHRLGGHAIDGQTSPTILAYNYFPNTSDMVIDTDEVLRWSNPMGDYLLFRNTVMHEIGHGLGLNHMESDDLSMADGQQFGSFLMEPILSAVFDGPQFDDILGAHRLYGDVNEKGIGNQTFQTATDLGILQASQAVVIGSDADDRFVEFADVDFVSIDDNSDVDYFSFTIATPMFVDLTLAPMGPTYLEGPQNSAENNTQVVFDASALSDLNLTLYDTDGVSILAASFTPGLGLTERIISTDLSSPGVYFVRVGGTTNAAQMFELEIASVPEPSALFLVMAAIACGCILRRCAC